MTKRTPWVLVAPLLGVVACANVWGFDDLTLGSDGGTSDATRGDDQATGSEGGGGQDGEADGAVEMADSGGDAADARGEEAGDSSPLDDGGRDASPRGDAGDGGILAATCKMICNTCCDSSNQCVKTATATACGAGGAMCVDCPACGIGSTTCCGTTSGQCGCAAAGLLCNKN